MEEKKMKKILTAIVTLMMIAVFACGAVAEDVTGEWYAEVYGMVMKMTVNADNTYVLEAAGEAAPGTWEMDGTNLIVDKGTETESVFAYDAAAQVLDMAGEMTFTRAAIEAWAPAAVRAGSSPEATKVIPSYPKTSANSSRMRINIGLPSTMLSSLPPPNLVPRPAASMTVPIPSAFLMLPPTTRFSTAVLSLAIEASTATGSASESRTRRASASAIAA
jgi:hypothetical protein